MSGKFQEYVDSLPDATWEVEVCFPAVWLVFWDAGNRQKVQAYWTRDEAESAADHLRGLAPIMRVSNVRIARASSGGGGEPNETTTQVVVLGSRPPLRPHPDHHHRS